MNHGLKAIAFLESPFLRNKISGSSGLWGLGNKPKVGLGLIAGSGGSDERYVDRWVKVGSGGIESDKTQRVHVVIWYPPSKNIQRLQGWGMYHAATWTLLETAGFGFVLCLGQGASKPGCKFLAWRSPSAQMMLRHHCDFGSLLDSAKTMASDWKSCGEFCRGFRTTDAGARWPRCVAGGRCG